jgi:hypothetical protein
MLTKPIDRAHAWVRISEDLGAEMSDPWTNPPIEPMTLGLGRGIDGGTFDPTSGHGKPLHLNVLSVWQKSRKLRAHEFFPL